MSDIQVAPAPWKLKGRTWMFVLPAIARTSSFPAGFAAPYEAETLSSSGEFIGGQGIIQIVSYSESPVGPYDELIYIPGRWKGADDRTGFRVTRIYVSTKESTANGRRNWNIPKQVADFNISTTDQGATTISVTHPGAASPFFAVTVKPVPLLSFLRVPYNTKILGKYFSLLQPPLPAGERPEEVGTSQWAYLIPVLKGKVQLVTITPELAGKISDGEGFPAITPWSVGIYINDVDMDFGVPAVFSLPRDVD